MKRITQAAVLAVWVAGCAAAYPGMAQDSGQPPANPAAMAKDADPDWDVVSVKLSDPGYQYDFFTVRGRHVIIKNETVMSILRTAYGLQKSQIIGLPDWVRTEHYDVDGVPDAPGVPDGNQMHALMRKLLAERFGMKVHREQREMDVYALTVTKGGPKMEPSKADPNTMATNVGGEDNGRQRRRFMNVSMANLAAMLQFNVDRPIIDRTGVPGRYDFKMQWTVDEADAGAADAPPGLFTAIQEQIGLKLEPTKAPAEVLVVDAVERPGAN